MSWRGGVSRRFSIGLIVVAGCASLAAGEEPVRFNRDELPVRFDRDDSLVRFNRDIRPILSGHCFKCHGPAVQEAGLRLDVARSAFKQLESENTAVVPRDPGGSELVRRITTSDEAERMPPAGEHKPLSPAQIELLGRWIAQGAPYEQHWAYIPPQRPPLPAVKDASWPRGDLDRFILARIEDAGLTPAPEASRATLIRRLSLDLTGLPPTPDEVRTFESDTAEGAYERLVDHLLASPQYGVRQALEWLDLARYADSDGNPHDGLRTVWPYRDWVVEAFNRDLPYDQFTIEQMAGDLLPEATVDQRVATAFHRHTRINREAGVDPEEFRLEAAIDRAGTTATVWLGATLACAQCHDHKFDPYSQRDYYRLLAFFNNDAVETTTDEAGRITDVSPRAGWVPPEQRARRGELDRQIAAASDPAERQRLTKERGAITTVETLAMRSHDAPRTTHVFARGSFLSPGESVTAGVPEIFGELRASGEDRLALARWLVDRRNPLTARVAVNRLWAQYFGTGLVETLDDLGSQAPACSHPELLDWLAVEWMERGWSLKALHKWIVTSATYRQAATADERTLAVDPQNRLLARSSRLRLPAELVRDNALAIGGILKTELGGAPLPGDNMRIDNEGQSRYRRSIYVRWKRGTLEEMFVTFDAPSRDVTCTRRARTNTPLQALNLLNDRVFMDAARGLAQRAQREGGSTFEDQLSFAFAAATARQPAAEELQTLVELHERRRSAFAANEKAAAELVGKRHGDASTTSPAGDAAWILVANAILNLNEVITRE